ncbi:MAG: hypothetical protein WCV50_03100 [Patescibacteria group bacterium]|jgi:hypothetical protein
MTTSIKIITKQKEIASIRITSDKFKIVTKNARLFLRLQSLVNHCWKNGLIHFTSGHGVKSHSIVIYSKRIMPGHPAFIDELIRQLGHEPWIASVNREEEAEISILRNKIRKEIIKYFKIPSLRIKIMAIVNRLNFLTVAQLKEIDNDLSDTADKI